MTTSQMKQDSGHYTYEYSLHAKDKIHILDGTAKTINDTLQINGLELNQTYYIKIKIFNGVSDSKWSNLEFIDCSKSKPVNNNVNAKNVDENKYEDPHFVSPGDAIMSHDGKQRIIWYFAYKTLGKNCKYYCIMHGDGTNEKFIFEEVFVSKSASLGIYYTTISKQKTHRYANKLYLCLKIFMQEGKKKAELIKGIKGKKQVTNKQYTNYCGYLLSRSNYVHVLDATTKDWSSYFKWKKSKYYKELSSAFLSIMSRQINKTIPPKIIMLSTIEFWKFIARDCKYGTYDDERKIVEDTIAKICNFDDPTDLQSIKTWTQMSIILCMVGAIITIKELDNYAGCKISEKSLCNLYQHLTDAKVFGKLQNQINNIEKMYNDSISELQASFWSLQTKQQGTKQFQYLLWYNLLCCCRSDPEYKNRSHLIVKQFPLQSTFQTLSTLDERLANASNSRPHPFHAQKNKMIMTQHQTTIRQILEIIDSFQSINDVYSFVDEYQRDITKKLSNVDKWLLFMNHLIGLLNRKPSKELKDFIIGFFVPRMKSIVTTKDIKQFHQFCIENDQFINETMIEKSLPLYEPIVVYKPFIPLFVHLLQPQTKQISQNYQYNTLQRCTKIWLKKYGLSETAQIIQQHQLKNTMIDIFENDKKFKIDIFLPNSIESRLQLIKSNQYEITIKEMIINTIDADFGDLSDNEKKAVTEVAELSIQNQPAICELLLRKLIKSTFIPFARNQSDKDKIKYIMTNKGQMFIDLLIRLSQHIQFEQLTIRIQLTNFADWWTEKIERIAGKSESYTTVSQLSSNNNFNRINELYTKANLKDLDDKMLRKAMENLDIYKEIAKKRNIISVFMNNFVPTQNKFYGKHIKKMEQLNIKLNKWDNTTLRDLTTMDFSVYEQHREFLEILKRESRSRIKISVFRSFVEAQEKSWTLKPLTQFSTRDTIQWLRQFHKEFSDADFSVIDMDYIIECFSNNEIRGTSLIDNTLNEEKIKTWFRSDEEEKNNDNDRLEDDYDKIAGILLKNITDRRQLDKDLSTIKDDNKIYHITGDKDDEDFKSLQQEQQKVGKIIYNIADELSYQLTVETATKYLTTLAKEDEKQIEKELRSIVDTDDDVKLEEEMDRINFAAVATSLKSLFDNLRQIEHYRILYDASQIFHKIMINYNEEKNLDVDIVLDEPYRKRYERLLSENISKKTTKDVADMKRLDVKILTTLSPVAINYLGLLNAFGKIINELFEKYNEDRKFLNKLRLFTIDSPIDRQRSIALKQIRDNIVFFVRNNFERAQAKEIKMSEIQKRLTESMQDMTEEDVQSMNIVTRSWYAMLKDFSDPSADQYGSNKKILNQIAAFEFSDESKQNEFDHEDTTTYLKIALGENDANNEEKQPESISQNRFSSLLDAISIFITDAIPTDISPKKLHEYSDSDLIKLLKEKQLTSLGLIKPSQMYAKIRKEAISGRMLLENLNIESITKLLFPSTLQDSMELDTVKKIASEIVRTADFMLLKDRIENEYIPKFNKCKQIAATRLKYYFEGAREHLDERQQRRISINQSLEQLGDLSGDWMVYLVDWKEKVEKLRQRYEIMTYFTVNDMRYILHTLTEYTVENNDENKKHKLLIKLSAKLTYIDHTITLNEVQAKIEEHCEQPPRDIEELGRILQIMFGDRIYRNDHIKMSIGNKIPILGGKTHLFYIEPKYLSTILHKTIKLFLSKRQRPTANRILHCDKTTTIEQVECILKRCALKGYAKDFSPLFCIVQPELLQPSVQDHLLKSIQIYINKSKSIFTIITADKDSRIYQTLQAFECWKLPVFGEKEKTEFFEEILCKSDDEFKNEVNTKPLCKLFMSKNSCVGKSYLIQKMAKQSGFELIHVPINTKEADLDFIVAQMYSYSTMPPNKIAFHINVSSDASYDVNIILFKLLVLRHLTRHASGESFAVLPNHAFFVELPSKLSSLKQTNIQKTLKHFHFITDKSAGIIHHEIRDSLQNIRFSLWRDRDIIVNELDITPKEKFVYKYLDALDQGILKNELDKARWDYKSHPDISKERSLELIGKYCKPARSSLVFLKSFTQYMYQQLILLYTSLLVQYSEEYYFNKKTKVPQYHAIMAASATKSAEQIACCMYEIPDIKLNNVVEEKEEEKQDMLEEKNEQQQKPVIDDKQQDKEISEATGTEQFHLIKYWAESKTEDGEFKPPLILLDQHPLQEKINVTKDYFKGATQPLLAKVCAQFNFENVDLTQNDAMIDAIVDYVGNDFQRDNAVWSYYQSEYILHKLQDDGKVEAKEDLDEAKDDEKEEKKQEINLTNVDDDIAAADRKSQLYGNSYSVLAYNLDQNQSVEGKELTFIKNALQQRKSKFDFYNFADDKNERDQAFKSKKYRVDENKQKQKLTLLLKLCGGFQTNHDKKRLKKVEDIYKANRDYALTFDNLLKMVAIYLRVKSQIPVLIMGETGCGKTKLLSFMANVLGLIMYQFDVHGGYSIADLVHDLQEPINTANTTTQTVLVFLDEINTSKEVGSFKEVVCDHSLKGTPLPKNLVIIAALNPYRARTKTTKQAQEEKQNEINNARNYQQDKVDEQISKLVYRVYPIPPSMKTYVWNFGYLTDIDEQQYICVMTETNWASTEITSNADAKSNAFPQLLSLYTKMICESQKFLRDNLYDVSVCSLRDVRRCNDLFKWFFLTEKRKKERKRFSVSIQHLKDAMILSLAQCYYYRLNERLRIKYEQLITRLTPSNQ
eukprot:492930_1